MTRILVFIFLSFSVVCLAQENDLKEGDIIFHTSASQQSMAIQLATHSKYSHCGVIMQHKGKWFVAEASRTVVLTPLQKFVERGVDKHYVVKRLKDQNVFRTTGHDVMASLFVKRFKGKEYDFHFDWSDEKIYCSELVWKLYKEALDVEIGALQRLGDFDLNSAPVKEKLKERYGEKVPIGENVISPASLYESDKLELVVER